MGQAFTLQFSYDEPFYLAVGCKSDRPLIVNTHDFPGVQRAFGDYLKQERKEEQVSHIVIKSYPSSLQILMLSLSPIQALPQLPEERYYMLVKLKRERRRERDAKSKILRFFNTSPCVCGFVSEIGGLHGLNGFCTHCVRCTSWSDWT